MPQGDNVHNLFAPSPEQMREHVEHLFGGYLGGCQDGLVELAWTDPLSHKLNKAQLYGTDDLDTLVEHAVLKNTIPGCNVYIGAALRRPGTAPFARAADGDFLALTAAYVDLDEEGAVPAAKARYGLAKPTKVVMTGTMPHPRAQLWWRLDEPIIDPLLSGGLLKGLAIALDGDPTVVNPGRVMRLAGTIAWPVKPDRVVEMTSIITPQAPLQASYTWGHLARLFPPPQPAAGGGLGIDTGIHVPNPTPGTDGLTRHADTFGLPGTVVDGREAYMLATLTACLVQLVGETGEAPQPKALFDLAWPQFAKGCDISKPRSTGQPWTPEEFAKKVVYTIGRFMNGKIQGVRSIADAKAIYGQKQAAHEAGGGQGRYHDFSADFGPGGANSNAGGASRAPAPLAVRSAFPIDASKIPPRRWSIPNLLLRGSVSMLVAPPGSGKSLLTLQVAIAIAAGIAWGGWTPRERQKVLIIAAEDDVSEMERRLVVAAREMGVDQASLVGWLDLVEAPETIVIARVDGRSKTVVRTPLVEDLVLTIQAGGYGVVVVDPFAETFEGDENSNSEIKWAGVLWREVARRTLISLWLVHHTRKYAGAMAGDADASRGGGAMIGIARVLGTLFTMTEDEALAREVDPEKRTDYVRYDDGKANYSRKGEARWFEKMTREVGNATAFAPTDEVGVLVPWVPPDGMEGITVADLNAALDAIDRGIVDEHGNRTGQYYTARASGADNKRWVGHALEDLLGCSNRAAKTLVGKWLKNKVFEVFEYDDPKTRKTRKAVRSILTNRPGVVNHD